MICARTTVWAAAVVVGACSHAQAAPPVAPPPPPAPTRVVVEDSQDEDNEPGVQIVNARGHMEQPAIEAGLSPHASELTECFTRRVGGRPWLGGHAQLHWDIRATGEVSSVKLAESDLGSHEIEKCLIDVARSAEFAKPIGGDADFALPLEFSAKGNVDVWDEDRSLRAIGGQTAKLDACATEVAKAKPPRPTPATKAKRELAPSEVVVTLYVGARGAVQSVGFSSSASEIGDVWARCATKAATAWRLPDPHGLAKLAIRYRFHAKTNS